MSLTPPRLLLIGLDGVNLHLLHHLLPPAVMPTLRGLMAGGAAGPLTSVFPTHSAAAWASFVTGQTPAGHGVFDFMARQSDGRYRHAQPDPQTTLWHTLGQAGYRGGVLNFPVTYPPMPVNGWLVSGMLSPNLDTFTYPAELAGELKAAFPDYLLDVEWKLFDGDPVGLLSKLTAMTQQRGRVARYLLAGEPLDYLAVAFIATDRAQHALWRYLEPDHPYFDAKAAEWLRPALHHFYHTLDEAVAGLLDCVEPETTVIVLSDHGFQSAAWQFHANDWLAQQGWLVYEQGRRQVERLLRRLDAPAVQQFRRRLFPNVSRYIASLAPGGVVDWTRTRAFCPWNFHQGIRLNLRGRDPGGIVDCGDAPQSLRDVSTALLESRHPSTGLPVVASVYHTAELYAGPYLAAMPDLVFDLRPNFAPGLHRQTLFEPTGWASGDHAREGFIVIQGAGVPAGTLV
ncbi:MAG: alkaline phosphatase family protein, partial [Chloroflexota bacterium]